MNEYLKTLEGISYSDWTKLKIAVDRSFEYKKRELEKTLKLSDVEQVQQLINSQFGVTPLQKIKESFAECLHLSQD